MSKVPTREELEAESAEIIAWLRKADHVRPGRDK
jgi:hypothetical protein